MPLSPSTSAMPGASRATLTLGFTLTAPPLIRLMYWGSRKMPWPSAPRRSARVMSWPQVAASTGGRPTARNASDAKRTRPAEGTREDSVVLLSLAATPHPTINLRPEREKRDFEGNEARARPCGACPHGFRPGNAAGGRGPRHRALRERGRHLRRHEPGFHHSRADRVAADAAAYRGARVH